MKFAYYLNEFILFASRQNLLACPAKPPGSHRCRLTDINGLCLIRNEPLRRLQRSILHYLLSHTTTQVQDIQTHRYHRGEVRRASSTIKQPREAAYNRTHEGLYRG